MREILFAQKHRNIGVQLSMAQNDVSVNLQAYENGLASSNGFKLVVTNVHDIENSDILDVPNALNTINNKSVQDKVMVLDTRYTTPKKRVERSGRCGRWSTSIIEQAP